MCVTNVTVIHGHFPAFSPQGSAPALDGMFQYEPALLAALKRPTTALLFPDLGHDDTLLVQRPELRGRKAVYLEQLYPNATVGRGDRTEIAPARRSTNNVPGAAYPDVDLDVRIETLVAIDGTWAQAKNIFRCTPALHTARRVCFSSGVNGEYTFRREPQQHCLSTLESLAHALPLLEPEAHVGAKARQALLTAFRCLVQNQLRSTAQAAAADRDPGR